MLRHNWPHTSKSGGLRSSFLLLTSYMKKLRYHLLLSRDTDDERILEQRHKWLNQKRYSLEDYHHAEIAWFLTEILMIEESCNHWTRGATSHIQPKVAVLDVPFLWWLSPCKKSKRFTDSFQKYWWSKNTAIWLVESILGHT